MVEGCIVCMFVLQFMIQGSLVKHAFDKETNEYPENEGTHLQTVQTCIACRKRCAILRF